MTTQVTQMMKAPVHDLFDINGYFADGFAGGFTRGYRYCRSEVVRKVFVSYSPRRGAYRVVEKQMGRG